MINISHISALINVWENRRHLKSTNKFPQSKAAHSLGVSEKEARGQFVETFARSFGDVQDCIESLLESSIPVELTSAR